MTVPAEFVTNGSFVLAIPADDSDATAQLYYFDAVANMWLALTGAGAGTVNQVWRRSNVNITTPDGVVSYVAFQRIAFSGLGTSISTTSPLTLEVR